MVITLKLHFINTAVRSVSILCFSDSLPVVLVHSFIIVVVVVVFCLVNKYAAAAAGRRDNVDD